MKTHIKATLRPASFLPQRFRQNAPGRSLPAQYESDWQNNRRCTYANRRQGDSGIPIKMNMKPRNREKIAHLKLILFSNRTEPFDNRPSGHASLPDCFFFHRFAIGERWGISSPKPLAWGPEPGAPSGRRSLAERRESQGATLVARRCEFPGSYYSQIELSHSINAVR